MSSNGLEGSSYGTLEGPALARSLERGRVAQKRRTEALRTKGVLVHDNGNVTGAPEIGVKGRKILKEAPPGSAWKPTQRASGELLLDRDRGIRPDHANYIEDYGVMVEGRLVEGVEVDLTEAYDRLIGLAELDESQLLTPDEVALREEQLTDYAATAEDLRGS